MRSVRRGSGSVLRTVMALLLGLVGIVAVMATTTFASLTSAAGTSKGNITRVYAGAAARGELDCNGFSPVQKPLRNFNCTDVRGFADVSNANTWGGKFYDNGVYIGHDEPDATFLSNKPGSGGSVQWNLTLGKDPTAAPTDATPGKDVSHWFELTPAPWLSMAICDPNSYPQLPCTPNSDANAPSGSYPGAGSAFMEMQFYPPGNAPFVDSESCNNSGWCAALTIDSLECTDGYALCNTDCEEPINFAFIQTNGVPAGPPSPQNADLASSVPNSDTLLMNPGDDVKVDISDAPVPGESGQKALKVVVDDLTTHRSGYMQASAKNGFQTTSMLDCSGTPFNFEPEYSTASAGNYIPWAALQTDISTEFETGHFEPCTSLSDEFATNPIDPDDKGGAGGTSGAYNECAGPYETAGGPEGPETGDAMCYAAGDVHNGYDGTPADTSAPDELTGCQDNWYQNGDLDFDGTPYWQEWPTSSKTTSKLPSSFVESLPTSGGAPYSQLFFQTDIALSESTCTVGDTAGCTVPPRGPGKFYPYWSEANTHGTCTLEFGNVSSGVNDFGKDAEYGTVQFATLGYPEFEGRLLDNSCPSTVSEGYFLSGKGGGVVSAGDAPTLANVHAAPAPVVGIAATPDGKGYYAVTSTGDVFWGGDGVFGGDFSTSSAHVSDIVGIALTPNGGGYWLLGANGAIYRFGDAKSYGSLVSRHVHTNEAVAVASSPSGSGYLIVTAAGTVYAFGDAHGHGSLAGKGVHVTDVGGIAPSASGTGYLLVTANGNVYAFGSGLATHGSLPGRHVHVNDIVGLALTGDGGGYWLAGSNGAVYGFGDAKALKSNLRASDVPVTGISGAVPNNPL
jgi:hypothetical protein